MKIFICGYSRSGKTHLARLLSGALGLKYVSASGWLRKWNEVLTSMAADESKQEYTERLTQISLDVLANEPDICINWVKGKYDIIEGLRNPRDFVHLYDPTTDIIVWCTKKDICVAATEFERAGLSGILNYVMFQKLIHPDLKMIEVEHPGPPDGLELQLESILEQLGAEKVWKLKVTTTQ